MSINGRYRGIVSALCTPLDGDGAVISSAVESHINEQIGAGISGLLPVGGTGEYISLTDRQRQEMLEVTISSAAGRVPVIASVLHPGLQDTIEAAKRYARAGADSVMVVTPYYYRPTQQGIVDYFKRVGDAVDADLVLYEIPYRTGVSLLPETVLKIVESTRTVAMKACNPDLAQQMGVVRAVGGRISILTGEESVFPQHISMGAVGGMLAGSNVFPKLWVRIFELASSGQLAEATDLHAKLLPATEALYSEPNPGPLKAALKMIGVEAGEVIEPMLPASHSCQERLSQVLPPALELEGLLEPGVFR